MSEVVVVGLVGGVVALLGAVVGASITSATDGRLWKRQAAVEVAHMLADTYPMLLGTSSHSVLAVHLEQIRVRLVALKVPEELTAQFEDAAVACWRESYLDYDAGNTAPDGGAWLEQDHLIAVRQSQTAIRVELGLERP